MTIEAFENELKSVHLDVDTLEMRIHWNKPTWNSHFDPGITMVNPLRFRGPKYRLTWNKYEVHPPEEHLDNIRIVVSICLTFNISKDLKL